MRLIDADALKEDFADMREGYPIFSDTEMLSTKDIAKIIDNAPTVEYPFYQEAYQTGYEEGKNERPQSKWLITAEDSEGIHRIQCPFCRYEKGSDFIDYITVTFEKFPPFCESCGAELRGDEE